MSFLNPLALLSPAAALLSGGKKAKRDPNTQYSSSMIGGATREPSGSLITSGANWTNGTPGRVLK